MFSAAPLLAWIERTLLDQMGLYVVPVGLLAAPLMAWPGLHGRAIAAAAPKAATDAMLSWGRTHGLKAHERWPGTLRPFWSDQGCTLDVRTDDRRSPTRTTIRAQPRHVLEELWLCRGKDTRLNDIILNECLRTSGRNPDLANRVLQGHHEDFLDPLHGHGFRIERGQVRATIDGNPSNEALDAAWKLVLLLDAKGREMR